MTHDNAGTQEKGRDAVVQQLIRESATTLPHEEVETIFNEEYSRLEREARVKSFLGLLTYRSAMKRLREQMPRNN